MLLLMIPDIFSFTSSLEVLKLIKKKRDMFMIYKYEENWHKKLNEHAMV